MILRKERESMCKYCEEHVLEEGGYDIETICEREESKYNCGCFTGIDVHLEKIN